MISNREKVHFSCSPPEVKGIVLDNILYDWWLIPEVWNDQDAKIRAVTEKVNSFQGWRDFEETDPTQEHRNPRLLAASVSDPLRRVTVVFPSNSS